MPVVTPTFILAGDAEWLARATTCPNRSIISPLCKSKGVAPAADSGEEVTLGESSEVVGLDGSNVSFIDFTIRNLSRTNQPPQPCGSEGIDFIVVNHEK
jgi:hypothetical protein